MDTKTQSTQDAEIITDFLPGLYPLTAAWMRNFGVWELAAAFLPASLLAGLKLASVDLVCRPAALPCQDGESHRPTKKAGATPSQSPHAPGTQTAFSFRFYNIQG